MDAPMAILQQWAKVFDEHKSLSRDSKDDWLRRISFIHWELEQSVIRKAQSVGVEMADTSVFH